MYLFNKCFFHRKALEVCFLRWGCFSSLALPNLIKYSQMTQSENPDAEKYLKVSESFLKFLLAILSCCVMASEPYMTYHK